MTGLLLALLLTADPTAGGAAATLTAKPTAPAVSETAGYLTPAERPDLTVVLAPPPAPASPRAAADKMIFRQTRAMEGSARWRLAAQDVSGPMFDHFAEALGVRLTPESAPRLHALLERAGHDRSVVGDAKARWNTRRPYLDNDGPICEPRRPDLAANGDYPSGHAAHGMHVALILAELVPGRKTEILARGRSFAESRYICGSHSQSAAEAGMLAGAAVYAAQHGSEVFRRDLEAARAELAFMTNARQ